jgi:hypothetical protein
MVRINMEVNFVSDVYLDRKPISVKVVPANVMLEYVEMEA